MTRLLKLAVVLFSIFSLASAQIVDTLNTPLGPVANGASVQVTWTTVAGADTTGKNGVLTALDSNTKNTTTIDPAVPLAPKTYMWKVAVPPGTYTLGLNDGSGLKQSGEVTVTDGSASGGGAPAAPAGGGGGSGSPAPSGGGGGGSAPAPAVSPAVVPPAAVSGGSPSSGSTASPSSSPAASSASSIFSGYGVVFSLLSVAIVMVQF